MSINKTTENRRLRFTAADDVALLREVVGSNPFEDPTAWSEIGREVNSTTNKNFTLRCLKEHVEHLIKLYIRGDTANLRKSGTEEEYAEKQHLLEMVTVLKKETMKQTKSVVKAKSSMVTRDSVLTIEDFSRDATRSISPTDSMLAGPSRSVFVQATESPTSSIADTAEPHRKNLATTAMSLAIEFLKDKAKMKAEFREKKFAFKKEIKEKELALKEREIELREGQLKLDRDKFELERQEREAKLQRDMERKTNV
ncbi:uncharacterized protein LOC106662404 [Cimex lectularius]|uniref:Regulatory protein zeste n=1 Tax=Cimex lectularius TaxID=79782 RepID=A0A8I6SPW6_CIMLE|nr:uncharacterized protein LOC106662404 [Cimex lectularius]